MGAALVPRALMESGVADVVFKALPESPVRSDVHLVWRERHLPDALLRCLLPHHPSGDGVVRGTAQRQAAEISS
jgi:DNA-binding transcriptional LysR family regulator